MYGNAILYKPGKIRGTRHKGPNSAVNCQKMCTAHFQVYFSLAAVWGFMAHTTGRSFKTPKIELMIDLVLEILCMHIYQVLLNSNKCTGC